MIGTYENRQNNPLVVRQIQLQDSAQFVKSEGLALDHGVHLSKGQYTDHIDTLVLQFKPYNRPKPRLVVIETDKMSGYKRNKRIDSNFIALKLICVDGELMPVPALINLIAQDSIIATLYTDEDGIFNFSSSRQIIEQLEVFSMGYDGISIPLNDYQGASTELQLVLTQQDHNTYDEVFRQEKYYWIVRGKHLVFIDENGKRGLEYIRLSKN
jgi:hypothetical protein